MIFIGFGFLMTFLKKYGYSSVGLNFLVAALVIQWSILSNAFWHQAFGLAPWHKVELVIETLITADFAAGAVLITFGAVLGKVTPAQLIVIALVEVSIYGINESIGAGIFTPLFLLLLVHLLPLLLERFLCRRFRRRRS